MRDYSCDQGPVNTDFLCTSETGRHQVQIRVRVGFIERRQPCQSPTRFLTDKRSVIP